MNDEYIFSDLISNSSLQKDGFRDFYINELNINSSLLNKLNNQRLVYFNKFITQTSSHKCIFSHLSQEEYGKFLNSTFQVNEAVVFLSLKSYAQSVLVQLIKLSNQCIFMASEEVLNLSESRTALKYVHNSVVHNGFESMKSQLSFIRNICEKMTFLLHQPSILRSKILKSTNFGLSKERFQNLLKQFLRKFILHINVILFTSYFIVFTGLESLSFSDIKTYSDNELWNFSRGIEEYNKMFNHIKLIAQSSLFRTTMSDCRGSVFAYLNKKIDPICLVKTISVRKVFKILSTFRSTIMAERIHRFLFCSKDVYKAIRHRYLNMILQPESAIYYDKIQLNSIDSESNRSDNSLNNTSRSLMEDIIHLNREESNNKMKYKKFVQRLSTKMKHSSITEEVNSEFQFIVSLLENVSKSTDLLIKLQISTEKFTAESRNKQSDESQIGKKNVQWRDSHDSKISNHMIKYYLDRYWYYVDTYLDMIESNLASSGSINPVRNQKIYVVSKLGSHFIHNSQIKIALSNLMKEPLLTKNFPSELKPCLYNQSLKMQQSARMYICEAAFCKALGFGHDDRFFSGQRCSNTCAQFLQILNTFKLELEQIDLEEIDNYGLPILLKCFEFINKTSNAIVCRTVLKFQKSLSSWNISAFIFLLYSDTYALLVELDDIFKLLNCLTESKKNESIYSSVRSDFEYIRINLERLKNVYFDMNEAIKNKVKISTLCNIKDSFPKDSFWLRKQNDDCNEGDKLSNTCFPPNSYVVSILQCNLIPIITSLRNFDVDCQKKAVSVVIETVLDTLLAYISERKLKFSFIGACQLEGDVSHLIGGIQEHLSDYLLEFIKNLPIVKDFTIIFDILKRQHVFEVARGNDARNVRLCSNLKAVKINETSQKLYSGNSRLELISPHTSNGACPNVNDWLKLRAHPLDSNVVTFDSCM